MSSLAPSCRPSCHTSAQVTVTRAVAVHVSARMGQQHARRSRSSCIPCQKRECIFCRIVEDSRKPGSNSRVVYQDEAVFALPDLRPAAAVHLLVLPKAHIPNTNSLQAADVQLVRHMLSVGQQLLEQHSSIQLPQPLQQQQQQQLTMQVYCQQQQQQQQQFKFGFHKPPFRSVDHLHMHCFVLPHKAHRWIQYQSSLNWITAEQLIDNLKRQPSAAAAQQQH